MAQKRPSKETIARAGSILEILRVYVYEMHKVSDAWIRQRSLYKDIVEIVEEDREKSRG